VKIQGGVAQDPLKPKHIPTVPDVVHRERVPEGVETEPDGDDPQSLP